MSSFADLLLKWYDENARSLPWRSLCGEQADPYHVWLSEIMLQQTTVATVKAYFEKFTSLWPTVDALAAAPQEAVLKEWAGLGYYARARNLHKCAGVISRDLGGAFPETEAGLKALPGVGDYTAAAIAAIAFGVPAAVVDGNIERITARQYRINTPLPKAKAEIKERVAGLTPKGRPGDFAQAMMDLGAGLCRPKAPKCLLCPVQQSCAAAKAGDMETYPVKAPKKVKPIRRAVSFWLEHDGHILLERRPQTGLLGGMPGLFSSPWVERADFPDAAEIEAMFSEHFNDQTSIDSNLYEKPGKAKHTFTHFHLETKLFSTQSIKKFNMDNGFWHPIDRLDEIGLPTVFKKIAKLGL